MNNAQILPMNETYAEYLRDESQFTGEAQSISFPRNEEEICSILRELRAQGIPVTVQGGKTGIAGSGVPLGSHLMNLTEFNRMLEFSEVDGKYLLTVEPGLRLTELKQAMARLGGSVRLFWPPEPTETSATVGGVAAMAACGIHSYAYGDAKQYFEGARVIFADGTVRNIRRGERSLNVGMQRVDELDAFLGSEGMLGIFSALTLRLLPCPEEQWGIAFFFPTQSEAWYFADGVQGAPPQAENAKITAAEYIDGASIRLLEEKKELLSKLNNIPSIDSGFDAMVYLEIAGEESGIEAIAGMLMELAQQCGSDPDCAWAVSGEKELESLRTFRHAIPETVNLVVEENHRNHPEVTKLSTDISFPGKRFSQVMDWYENCLRRLKSSYCIFGHIGDNHVHCNIFSKDASEQEQCEAWMRWLLQQACKIGGRVVQENGIGKIKRKWIPENDGELMRMQILKSTYDANGFWNPGNMFSGFAERE
ncbi:MAG: D-lactate dehydrogenase (Cytochrome) [Eubacteriales bacterium]